MTRPLVLIPSKDNAGTIADVVRRSLAHHPDVLVVDDGCTDGTPAEAAAAGAIVVSHGVNRGKGAALDTGLRWAQAQGFTHVIALDADGQHFPEDIPAFLAAVNAEPGAIHAGARQGMEGAPGVSQFGRKFSNFWVKLEGGEAVADSQCGFRAYPVDAVLALGLPPGRYEWEVEVLVRAQWAGVPVRDLPCRVYYPPPQERVSSFDKRWDNLRISLKNARLVTEKLLRPRLWRPGRRAPGWEGSSRGFLLGWRLFLAALRVLGPWPVYAAMVPMSVFYLLFASAGRRGLGAYLQRRFPEEGPAGRLWRSWRIFLGFAITLVDRFVLLLRGPSAFAVTVDEDVQVKALADEKQGFLVIATHLGNPEMGAGVLAHLLPPGRRLVLVQHTAPGDPYPQLVRELAGQHGLVVLSGNAGDQVTALTIARHLRAGDVVALKADRVIDDRSVPVELLGGRARLPAGPWLLAGLTRAPVVYQACFREGLGRYRVLLEGPEPVDLPRGPAREAALAAAAQRMADRMAAQAKRWPEQWYNFHDMWAAEAASTPSSAHEAH